MADSYFGVSYIPLERRVAFKKGRSDERRQWLEHQHLRNPRCHYCKNTTELMQRGYNCQANHAEELFATVDHLIPTARGGKDHSANWRLSCAVCNLMKGDMSEAEYVKFLVETGVRDA